MAKTYRFRIPHAVTGILTALLLQAAMTLPVFAQEVHRFDIDTTDAATAIHQFGNQAGVQIVAAAEALDGKQLNRISGDLSTDDGFQKLLAGTGLAHRYVGERAVALVSETTAPGSNPTQIESVLRSPDNRTAKKAGFWDRFRLAQNDNNQSAKNAETSTQDETEKKSLLESPHDDTVDLGEVVVTGTNIRGVYPSSSPVEVYTAEDIARTGATTTEQFINRLPQNTATISPFASDREREGASGVDLRGLGAGTTLVLLNGQRTSLASRGRSADISMIPASAIDRVEVLTDGASAIYGADAIGGVVNFVLQDDFEGAETRLSYGGVTSGGLRQGNFTQTFGSQWGSGHGLISYDYFTASALERADRDFSAPLAPGTLTPHDARNNLLITVSQNLSDRLTLSGDIVLGQRDVKSEALITGGSPDPLDFRLLTDSTEETQSLVNFGIDYELSDVFNASLRATYSENETNRRTSHTFFNDPSQAPFNQQVVNNHTGLDITAMLDGVLFELPGGEVRFSLGAGLLDEDYTGENDGAPFAITGSEMGRTTTYAFAELFAPLIGPDQNVPFVHRLELSLAGRFTDTEDQTHPSIDRDFGSATDPKVGLLWAPFSGLNLRATYGTSFRAPSLPQLDPVGMSTGLLFGGFPIPFPGGPTATVLQYVGVSPDIDAESAETYTLGFDFRPETHSGFELSVTYYNIDYTDRIAVPDFVFAPFLIPGDFPELLIQQPSAAFIEELLRRFPVDPSLNFTAIDLSDPAAAAALLAADPNFWVYDIRARNLALSYQDGLDLSISNHFDTSWGEAQIGANVTTIFEYEQSPLAGRPAITVVDRPSSPVDLRARIFAGLSRNGFDGTVSVNYVDGYFNPVDPVGPRDVDSWTTVDLNLSYAFATEGRDEFLNGFRIYLTVQNLFDRDPPFVSLPGADGQIGFDPQNANPLGRFVVIGLSKSW